MCIPPCLTDPYFLNLDLAISARLADQWASVIFFLQPQCWGYECLLHLSSARVMGALSHTYFYIISWGFKLRSSSVHNMWVFSSIHEKSLFQRNNCSKPSEQILHPKIYHISQTTPHLVPFIIPWSHRGLGVHPMWSLWLVESGPWNTDDSCAVSELRQICLQELLGTKNVPRLFPLWNESVKALRGDKGCGSVGRVHCLSFIKPTQGLMSRATQTGQASAFWVILALGGGTMRIILFKANLVKVSPHLPSREE